MTHKNPLLIIFITLFILKRARESEYLWNGSGWKSGSLAWMVFV